MQCTCINEKMKYTVHVHLYQDTGKVSYASCSCASCAGRGGCCKHVAALLFQILDFIQLELSEVPDDLTCTQFLQQWHVPSREDLKTALLFDNIKFSKATSRRKCHKVENINPAPGFAKNVTQNDIRKLREGLNTTESCNYFEKLLESNNCQRFDYNEYLAELPSTKQFFTGQQSADQMFNAEIRKSVLSEIGIS